MDNRRDFFRIQVSGYIDYFAVESEEADTSRFYRHPLYADMLEELHHLDTEASHLLAGIERDRALAPVARHLGKKIDLIARTVAFANSDWSSQDIQTIDLSEGGLGFSVNEPFQQGDLIAVKLLTSKGLLSLVTIVEVLSCEQDPSQPEKYQVRSSFKNLSDTQRQSVARHILRAQQLTRRQSNTPE